MHFSCLELSVVLMQWQSSLNVSHDIFHCLSIIEGRVGVIFSVTCLTRVYWNTVIDVKTWCWYVRNRVLLLSVIAYRTLIPNSMYPLVHGPRGQHKREGGTKCKSGFYLMVLLFGPVLLGFSTITVSMPLLYCCVRHQEERASQYSSQWGYNANGKSRLACIKVCKYVGAFYWHGCRMRFRQFSCNPT